MSTATEPLHDLCRARPLFLPPGNREKQGALQKTSLIEKAITAKALKMDPYFSAYDDFSPAHSDLSTDALQDNNKIIIKFGDKMYDVFSFGNSSGKAIWADFH